MSSSRVRATLSIGSVCIFLLFLLLPQINPDPVKAAWDPKIANGAPKDPGTPFEEPEGGDPGSTHDPYAPRASVGGGQWHAPKPGLSPEAAKVVVRQLVLRRLVLFLWRLQ
jgi:hypothetical protein